MVCFFVEFLQFYKTFFTTLKNDGMFVLGVFFFFRHISWTFKLSFVDKNIVYHSKSTVVLNSKIKKKCFTSDLYF